MRHFTNICCVLLAGFCGGAFGQEVQNTHCILPHDEKGYVSWLCDNEGKAVTTNATIYNVRANRFGATKVFPVWSGTLVEWTDRSAKIIAEHRKANLPCSVYFHVARLGPPGGETQWNRVTKHMREWWEKEGRKKFPSICYCTEPWLADYVVLWSDFDSSIPYSYSIPLPQTSYVTGTTSGWVGGQYVYGNYSGLVTTTQMKTYEGSWNVWNFLLAVRPVRDDGKGSYLGTPLFWSEHEGKWRWSKPDKDSLIDALRFIQK